MVVLGLFYIVLGSQAVALGAYLLSLTPGSSPSPALAALVAQDPGIVRWQGSVLLLSALPFFANGVALLRARWWARWSTLLLTPLHVLALPFGFGGLLYAVVANLYLFGSGRARAYFEGLRQRPVAQPS